MASWFAAAGVLNLQAWVPLIFFPVLAALVILLVMVAVAGSLNPSRHDFAWFIRLRRPRWLVFEGLIPLIWLLIYGCFYISAWLTWQASWSALWMATYLLQLV
jgi:tryptophan-rich sensory protein